MSIVVRAHRALLRQPRWLIALLCAALLGAVGVADYATGPDVTVVPFYLVPIGVATWYLGRIAGTTSALISAVVVLSVNAQGPGYAERPYQLMWNFIVRLMLFMAAEMAIAAQRELRARQPRSGRASGERSRVSALHSDAESG